MDIKQFTIGALMTNCYMLSDSGEAVLIDAAIYDEEIAEYIKENNLTLKTILLTHGHFDHTFGAQQFADKFDAPIAIGQKDIDALDDPNLSGAVFFGIDKMNKIKECAPLYEGDNIKIGNVELTVLDTPGHTIGGVSYYAKGHLFSGDTLFERSVGRTDLANGSFEQIATSIKTKLYTLPDDTKVYPGHGGLTSISYEKANNPYVPG